MQERRFAGVGLVVVGLALPAAFAFEAATRPAGTDGDNAAESLLYLREHGTAYRLSGLCLVLAALGLIRAATAVPWRTAFLTSLGGVAGGLWVFAGALRLSSPGPIGHIEDYDRDWGEAAYLVVQMAGTQGALLGGFLVAEVWIITGCWLAWRRRTLPRGLCALGLVALVYPLAGAAAAIAGDVPDLVWVLGIASLVLGVPVWFLGTGSWALVTPLAPASAVDTGH